MSKKDFTKKKLRELVLDINNPRFAELYDGSNNEDDLIEYLLYTESADEVANGIINAKEFYPDRPLWVLEVNGKFLVKDGNRRCAAVKALQHPNKYDLSLPKFQLKKLPVLIYHNENDLEKRKLQEHTSSLFKKWGRIAKALEVYRLHLSGSSTESMIEIDSKPSDLIKLASFYYEAVKIGGEDLKKLLRRGKGKTGGKTIIFERLFKYRDLCGYKFKNKPSYQIDIYDSKKFSKYISAMVEYLNNNSGVSHKVIDREGRNFLKRLDKFGFSISDDNRESKIIKKEKKGKNNQEKDLLSTIKKRKSIRNKPVYERKGIPVTLEKLINECYNLDNDNFYNAKTVLTRVTFECALKYITENTKHNNKKLSGYDFFKRAFFNKKGEKLKYVNFEKLKSKFIELIEDTGKRKAFVDFDLEHPHQVIHNYNVGATPINSMALCDNLICLLEFMLQDECDLLDSLDLNKL